MASQGSTAHSGIWVRLSRLPPVEALLRIPLLHKVVVANVVVVAVVVAAATVAVRRLELLQDVSGVLAVLWVAGLGIVLSAAVNVLLARLALLPLRELGEVATSVAHGDLEARVPESPLADAELRRLRQLFNEMLDAVTHLRRQHRRLTGEALEAEARARKHLGAELHDGVAQELAGLFLLAERILRLDGDEEVRKPVRELRAGLSEVTEEIRRLARGLHPRSLDDLGLAEAVQAYARKVMRRHVRVRVEAEAVQRFLGPEEELVLYRILQEAVSNAARYADPECVDVRLWREDGLIRAEVTDDGRGFDPSRAVKELDGGLGIFVMRERAAYVGGRVDVESRPGEGTRVKVRLPALPSRPDDLSADPGHLHAGEVSGSGAP